MKVKKFGGTSVGSARRMKEVARLISGDGRCVVVLSAMSGTTNRLLGISSLLLRSNKEEARQLLHTLKADYAAVIDELYDSAATATKAREITDAIFADLLAITDAGPNEYSERETVARGELLSTNLMKLLLDEMEVSAALLPALDFMKTDIHGEPDFPFIREHAAKAVAAHPEARVLLTQGFICRNAEGGIDNLRRGGSDYSASLIGAAINADLIEIWTDIDGMHDNDPRFVENTSPVHNLHFDEAAELAYFGAKILHPTCILPAKENNIPVRLLNTMEPDAEGTLIDNNLRKGTIKAVAAKDNITAIKIKSGRMLLAYGFLKKVFEVFERYEKPIDMITTSEVGVSVTIDNETHLAEIVEELHRYGSVSVDRDMVIICVVGDLQWRNRGFEALALDALADLPVRMISYGGSNYNISFLVEKENKTEALRRLSNHLFKN